jgi:ATP-dependent protease HslVU (ClpYQ) peptidase subunit
LVAIKKDGIVYMGADSQVSCGGTRSTLSNPNNYKIWAMQDVDNCLMGSVGALRANNVMKVADDLIPEIVDLKGAVSFRFVVRHLVPRMFDELDEYKLLAKDRDDAVHMDASFLLAYHDRLYSIDRYGCVIEVDDFCAIGSGSCEALGSLLSSKNVDDPVERIKMAIKASAAHDIYVDYPIVISDTEDTEFKVYYEKDL